MYARLRLTTPEKVAPGSPLHWAPPGGAGTVRVLDDFGRLASRDLRVEFLP